MSNSAYIRLKRLVSKSTGLLFWVLLVTGSQAISQDFQLSGFSVTGFSETEITGTSSSQKIQVNEYNFFLNLPVQFNRERTTLINGFQYNLVTLFMDDDANSGLDEEHLHLISYRLTALHQLTNNWTMFISLNPTLSSAFNTRLEGEDVLFNGALLLMKKKLERFTYGGGIAYISSFGEPTLVPTLKLTLNSKNDRLDVFLPRRITYDRYFGKFTAGMQVSASGSYYNINKAVTSTDNNYELFNKLAYSRILLGPVLSYRLGKNLKLETTGGIVITRKADLQGEPFNEENYEIANGPFFKAGIVLVPPQKR